MTSRTGLPRARARWMLTLSSCSLSGLTPGSLVLDRDTCCLETKGFAPLYIKSSSCIYFKKASTFQSNLSCLVNCIVVCISRCRFLYFMFVISARTKSSGYSRQSRIGVLYLCVLWLQLSLSLLQCALMT